MHSLCQIMHATDTILLGQLMIIMLNVHVKFQLDCFDKEVLIKGEKVKKNYAN